jgi:alpha-L-fucosidase 2
MITWKWAGIPAAGLPVLLFACTSAGNPVNPAEPPMNPATTLWYAHPAEKWEDALPVGNGRLGAMVFGKTDEERIALNEETCWSGGPYSQTVKGGAKVLPEIQRLVFQGEFTKAHKLFGRHLMGYPVEQMKYQSLGNLVLRLPKGGAASDYRHELDLDQAVDRVTYAQDGVRYVREVFATAVDNVIAVRIAADRPGSVSLAVELRGERNDAHSNYATDYFRMDVDGPDGLRVAGKSADYLGVAGAIRYRARLKAVPEGGRVEAGEGCLTVSGSDTITFYIAAATNFVNYKDVSADPDARVSAALQAVGGKTYAAIREAHVRDHRSLFRRVSADFGTSPDALLPTDERKKRFDGANDPALAALCLQFGRYLLIASSRPGTEPANLQGIWNASMNPSWDSKFTTNINTQMNYWPAEVGNLSECAEPLFRLIRELTDQGADVAREHYGARGWVHHQNTDLWRVAAPMDGPQWGTFTTGGAWLCAHLWEHYRYTGDRAFLKASWPVLRGSAEFFLDFLVEHPKTKRLVTNPSSSPENFPVRPGDPPFFDEITGGMYPGTTICAGSTIDLQILHDLFGQVAEASAILGEEPAFREKVLAARARLAPMQVGRRGDLQEWLEDWDQREKSHRHISNLYGLFPGNSISQRRTPDLARACAVVLDQRGLDGNGWASAWKMACWARLRNAEQALANFRHYIHQYTTGSLFAICAKSMQVDGSFGVAAAIPEMLIQSQEGELHLLPAVPRAWPAGEVRGLCARGGFVVDLAWKDARLASARITSRLGGPCRIRAGSAVDVLTGGKPVESKPVDDGALEFLTQPNGLYELRTRTP